MRKVFIISILLLTAFVTSFAIPAKPGQWTTITLSDGTSVMVQAVGDEHGHFFQAADGTAYQMLGDGSFVQTNQHELLSKARFRKAQSNARRAARQRQMAPNRVGDFHTLIGEFKGLVILVEYTDVKFKSINTKEKFLDILNTDNYVSDEGFIGSVKDYFIAQSDSLFTLTFDVVGPVQLAHNMKYYGENDENGYDKRPGEMIVEGCNAVVDSVNFADYDWDNDGEVDQVYVIYAGYGEADNSYTKKNTVWPHEWSLSAAVGHSLNLDGVTIDTYACGCELSANGVIDGIGTICHEFSHCLGYPDTYDSAGTNQFGMGSWDVMCNGCYNGNGFCPPNYTAYEKMVVGWITPIELTTDTLINNLLPTSQRGNAYKLVNSGHSDEYFLIESRQQDGWDKKTPGKGLMISYIDYDEDLWYVNFENSIGNYADIYGYRPSDQDYDYYHSINNDHQRLTFFRANNKGNSYSAATDLYPYRNNDSLTPTSKPASTLYHPNANGKLFMDISVVGIMQNDDGTMSFRTQVEQEPNMISEPKVHTAASQMFYTLDGRKLHGKPMSKGLYINNGRKIVVK